MPGTAQRERRKRRGETLNVVPYTAQRIGVKRKRKDETLITCPKTKKSKTRTDSEVNKRCLSAEQSGVYLIQVTENKTKINYNS
jgi:hypothetical protein